MCGCTMLGQIVKEQSAGLWWLQVAVKAEYYEMGKEIITPYLKPSS